MFAMCHFSKIFTYLNLFNPYNNFTRYPLLSPFTDYNKESHKRRYVTCSNRICIYQSKYCLFLKGTP